MFTPEQLAPYQAAHDGVGYAILPRTRISITGQDRATMLHKFCTQDILARKAGQGGEAFICNVQGKIVGYVYFFVGGEQLLLDATPEQAEKLIGHLDRYVIREDVQFHDRTTEQQVVVVTGAQAAATLNKLVEQPIPSEMYGFVMTKLGAVDVRIERVPYFAAETFFVVSDQVGSNTVIASLHALGVVALPAAVCETLRIEAATPLYGSDISLENLPQEVARDLQAINFKKGCYLGQETVARIDAVGHVNKLLAQVKFSDDPAIPAGTELLAGDKVVGKVTSSAWSPKFATWLALAYVRREQAKVGTRLHSASGDAEVVTSTV